MAKRQFFGGFSGQPGNPQMGGYQHGYPQMGGYQQGYPQMGGYQQGYPQMGGFQQYRNTKMNKQNGKSNK